MISIPNSDQPPSPTLSAKPHFELDTKEYLKQQELTAVLNQRDPHGEYKSFASMPPKLRQKIIDTNQQICDNING